jgi:hypothetical protein
MAASTTTTASAATTGMGKLYAGKGGLPVFIIDAERRQTNVRYLLLT